MPFRVEFSVQGRDIADGIFRWIAERSPDGASRWKAELQRTISRIADAADTFALAAESDLYSEPVREVYFKTRKGKKYRALFIIRGEVAYIVSVRAPGQDLVGPDELTLPE